MNESLLIALLVCITGALPLILVGYQISVNNKLHWINGVDLTKLSNPKGFGHYVGNSITITGMVFIILSVLLYLEFLSLISFVLILVVVSFLPLPCFFIAKQKYT